MNKFKLKTKHTGNTNTAQQKTINRAIQGHMDILPDGQVWLRYTYTLHMNNFRNMFQGNDGNKF